MCLFKLIWIFNFSFADIFRNCVIRSLNDSNDVWLRRVEAWFFVILIFNNLFQASETMQSKLKFQWITQPVDGQVFHIKCMLCIFNSCESHVSRPQRVTDSDIVKILKIHREFGVCQRAQNKVQVGWGGGDEYTPHNIQWYWYTVWCSKRCTSDVHQVFGWYAKRVVRVSEHRATVE